MIAWRTAAIRPSKTSAANGGVSIVNSVIESLSVTAGASAAIPGKLLQEPSRALVPRLGEDLLGAPSSMIIP
jgi:hypothetical protein